MFPKKSFIERDREGNHEPSASEGPGAHSAQVGGSHHRLGGSHHRPGLTAESASLRARPAEPPASTPPRLRANGVPGVAGTVSASTAHAAETLARRVTPPAKGKHVPPLRSVLRGRTATENEAQAANTWRSARRGPVGGASGLRPFRGSATVPGGYCGQPHLPGEEAEAQRGEAASPRSLPGAPSGPGTLPRAAGQRSPGSQPLCSTATLRRTRKGARGKRPSRSPWRTSSLKVRPELCFWRLAPKRGDTSERPRDTREKRRFGWERGEQRHARPL